jgi:hypothetical protein
VIDLDKHWSVRILIILCIACLYAGAVGVNNQLFFPWAEFDTLRYVFFLPAGLKLLLLMVFGWRAVIGLTLGIATIALSELTSVNYFTALAIGFVSGLSPYLGLRLVGVFFSIKFPWSGLNLKNILAISIFIGLLDALTLHLALSFSGFDKFQDLGVDLLPAAGGRIFGTLIFLGLAVRFKQSFSKILSG